MNEAAGRAQLRRFGDFVATFASRLESGNGRLRGPVSVLGQDESSEIDGLADGAWRSGNELVDKVLRVLVALGAESRRLQREAEAKFLPALLLYGEEAGGGKSEGALMSIGRFLPLLQELAAFLHRLNAVVANYLRQIAALTPASKYYLSPANERLIFSSAVQRNSSVSLSARHPLIPTGTATDIASQTQHTLLAPHYQACFPSQCSHNLGNQPESRFFRDLGRSFPSVLASRLGSSYSSSSIIF